MVNIGMMRTALKVTELWAIGLYHNTMSFTEDLPTVLLENFPHEEVISSHCHNATAILKESFPDHERVWSACNYPPLVEYHFDSADDRLVVKYSMIFRRAGGKIYRTVASNRIYRNALEAISEQALQVILEGWTRDFLDKVSRAKATRDVVQAETHLKKLK